MVHDPSRLMARKIRLAQMALALERLMALAFPALMTAGFILLVLTCGGLRILPDEFGRPVLVAGLLCFLISLMPLGRWRWPAERAGVARIDRLSGRAHRPLASLSDAPAGPALGPAQQIIWAAHRQRLLSGLAGLRAGWPQVSYAARDPLALRNGLAVALIAAFGLNGAQLPEELARAWQSRGSEAALTAAGGRDVWITPPAYTGRAPLLLPAAGSAEDIRVPQGSRVVVRVSGALSAARAEIIPQTGARQEIVLAPSGVAAAEGQAVLPPVAGELRVQGGSGDGDEVSWRFSIIPDLAPVITLRDVPARSARGGLVLSWRASDDYGLARIGGEVTLTQAHAPGASLFPAPELSLTLPRANAKQAESKTIADLTAHPWAGLGVSLKLSARDQAGQAGTSAPLDLVLPERSFRQPVAQYLIDLRKRLVREGDVSVPEIVEDIDQLLLYPRGLIASSGIYLALQSLELDLARAQGPDGVRAAVAGLWEIAIRLEEGSSEDARKAVEQARQALAEALSAGLPQEEIAKRIEALRQAMAALMEQMQRAAAAGARSASPQAGQGQTVRPEELAQMLDQLARLAQGGQRDQAQQLLSALDEILKNLQAGPGMSGGSAGETAGEMLDRLSDLMRRQQQLMDKTFRAGADAPDPQALAQDQDAIARDLAQLLAGLGQQGLAPPAALGQAGAAMGRSGEALGRGERESAMPQQGEAIAKMREGAAALAQAMSAGEGSNPQSGRDPLGRPRAGRGPDYGPQDSMIRSEADAARARQILDELRQRANAPGLGAQERRYLDRLLKDFY